MWNFLQKYIKSDREYEIRFALVMYLDYFIDVKYLRKIFCQIEDIKNEEYYVRMAIAWFLAESFIKERNLTLDFLERAKIDGWTYNKALQKIVESYRVSEEDKEMARKMKKCTVKITQGVPSSKLKKELIERKNSSDNNFVAENNVDW